MIRGQNFSGQAAPNVRGATEFERCNFAQTNPVDIGGGTMRGVRLWPGDDTPRVFTRCNLVNCEPPPGSTIVNCNTTIRTLERDGDGDTTGTMYGRLLADGTYEDLPSPRVEVKADPLVTYFVDTVRGDDDNDGRAYERAFRTLVKAQTVARSRDQIVQATR